MRGKNICTHVRAVMGGASSFRIIAELSIYRYIALNSPCY